MCNPFLKAFITISILGLEIDTFSLLNRAIYSLSDYLLPCLMLFKCCESHSGFQMLANCSTNVSVNWAKEHIELLGRFVYHCKAGLIRLDPNPLHMHASPRSLGMAVVNIHCLYCAMWSSGSVVPSYSFMFGKLNFRGISTRAMFSVKGESTFELKVLF